MFDLQNVTVDLPGLAAAFFFGYLLGSIAFGVVLTRLAAAADLRSMGSGNIGATNVLRTGRKDLAAATLVGDALKGTAAVLIAGIWGPAAAMAAGLGAILGHLFPVWLGFRGGKGVATYVGVLAGVVWPAAIAFAAVWAATAALSRYSSLAALVAASATPLVIAILGEPTAAWFFAGLTLLIFVTHRSNIARLIHGQEARIGGERTGR